MAYHVKRIRLIQFSEGIDGVRRYKDKWPEAGSIQVKASAVAFQQKPKGYDDALCSLVRLWFASDLAIAETNRATIARLNERLQSNFDPDRHFSVPLSAKRLDKIAAIFSEHGAHLDTRRVQTMSEVRAAVKAARGLAVPGRSFARIGRIAEGQLVCGNQVFRIEQHSGHDCIRVPVNGSRVRLRLDALAEFISAVGLVSGGGIGYPPEYLLSVAIREPAPNAETGTADPLPDPLSDHPAEELAPTVEAASSDPLAEPALVEKSPEELAPIEPPPQSPAERLAACKAEEAAMTASTYQSSDDPLSDPLIISRNIQ